MKKIVLTVCVVFSVFIINSSTAMAAVCQNAPDGVHHFSEHVITGGAYDITFTHNYIYGYDHNNKPIYKECQMTDYYSWCMYKCKYCSVRNTDEGRHVHITYTTHSVNHN